MTYTVPAVDYNMGSLLGCGRLTQEGLIVYKRIWHRMGSTGRLR